jgi:hypothetical protein
MAEARFNRRLLSKVRSDAGGSHIGETSPVSRRALDYAVDQAAAKDHSWRAVHMVQAPPFAMW